MICRISLALDISSDELLGLKRSKTEGLVEKGGMSLKLVRRLKRIDQLPIGKQSVLLQTIDGFLKGEGVAG